MAKVYIPRTLRLFTNGDFEIILGGEKYLMLYQI